MVKSSDTPMLQKKILEIFIKVKSILEQNNLRYFAIGGICLGAVLHKGFIPWDDDLDIAMPENDYEEFWRIAEQELPLHLKLLNPSSAKYSIIPYCKIYNKNTTYIGETR